MVDLSEEGGVESIITNKDIWEYLAQVGLIEK